ncbi:mechanosensitive ion channel family protein [Priestia filamentosa]|uniref:mechanosensitive ion channel family protein n=1 Tax=Priestia filamentosa TaxID=1402861 RepID=UPI00397AA64F
MKEIANEVMNFLKLDWGSVRDYFISLFLTTLAAYIIIVVIRFLLHHFFARTSIIDEKKEETIESVFKNSSSYIILTIFVITAIRPFAGDLKELIVASSVIAAVIGFGAQRIIGDLLAGAFILFEKSMSVGDFVHLNDEPEGGEVEEMGFRIVKIRLINGKLITISNGEIRKIVNGSVEKRRIFESVVVSYNENPNRVRKLLEELCQELNEKNNDYLKKDKFGDFEEAYQIYGLSSLDANPLGYRFSITATVKDKDYFKAAQETKYALAQKLYDNGVSMPTQRVSVQQATEFQGTSH